MLHPVGPLPAAVYWRRRVLVLGLLAALVGGGSWVGASLLGGSAPAAEASAVPRSSGRAPALDRVLPSPAAAVVLPTTAPSSAPPAGPATGTPDAVAPCPDDAIGLQVRTQAPGAAPGAPVTVELVVTNTSPVACARALDLQLQEIVLLDGSGARVWGSDDCSTATSADTRTLAPGQVVVFPVTWDGRTSQPGCTAARTTPPPGSYVFRGRLDARTTPDAPLTLG